ncbi:MAG: restriction endonuclease [Candidatus Obscuribacterales bacterium]|jgi:restriction system protein
MFPLIRSESKYMGRRKGFSGFVTAVAREAAREQREQIRVQKFQERLAKQRLREEKQDYLESQAEEAAERNNEISSCLNELNNVLKHTLTIDDTISFDSLKQSEKFPPYKSLAFSELPPPSPSFIVSLLPWLKGKHAELARQWESRKENFDEENKKSKESYALEKEQFVAKVQQQHAEIDDFKTAYTELDSAAIIAYNGMVLERSEYPANFPQKYRLAYVAESKELVIEYKLPTIEIVPTEDEFRYVKTKDEIVGKPRKAKEIKDLYQDVVAAISLRTLHEVFEADQANALDVAVFNGYVKTRDPATGKQIKPCLISIRVTKERFRELDLEHVDKKVCLRNLGAQVSPRPDELLAVKPVVEFDMVDKRFVDQADLLTELESRPNLMELTPTEFENLVSNLFGQLGLESKLTRSSKDGGVDCVAFDNRPVLGGKVVIQAKRYRHTVGVSAVRDLYGTMQHEGANKGILVATSGYGPDAFNFAKDKPIELIGGSQLLYLLEQIGVEARIVMPAESGT